MKTKVFGESYSSIVIKRGLLGKEIKCDNAIVKLQFSDGTLLGIKYGICSKLFPNIWHIRVLNQGTCWHRYTQCFKETLLSYSDIYETDAELTNYEVIPSSVVKERNTDD